MSGPITRSRSQHDPVALTPQAAASLSETGSGSRLHLGGIWGAVQAGQTWIGTDGERLILTASPTAVVYLLDPRALAGSPRFYMQSAAGFRGEVTTAPAVLGARRARPMVRLAEIQVQIIMGIVAATSGVGLAAVVGTDLLRFTVENQENFRRWSRLVSAAVAARETLRRHAPRLYEKLIQAALLALVKDVLPATGGQLSEQTVARIVGSLLGKLGRQAAETRLAGLSAAWTIALEFAKRLLMAVPGAAAAVAADYGRSAEELVGHLRALGVTLSKEDINAIAEEIRRHPREVTAALEDLANAAR
jgi:hypothetical protein